MALNTTLVRSQLQPILRSAQRSNVDSDENHGCIPQIEQGFHGSALSSLLPHVAVDGKDCIENQICMWYCEFFYLPDVSINP